MELQDLFSQAGPVPGFTRIIGTDEAGRTTDLLRKALASRDTAYVPDGLPNPAPSELDEIARVTNRMPPANISAARKHIQRYMPGMGNDALPGALFDAVESVRKTTPGAAYTAYAKMLYWCKHLFAPAFGKDASNPLVVISGPMSKHGVLALEAVARSTVAVWYFDPVSDESYKKGDPSGKKSKLVENPVRTPVPSFERTDGALPAARGDTAWQTGLAPWDAMLVKERPACAGAVLAYVAGTGERAAYRNILYNLSQGLADRHETVLRPDVKQTPPDNDEIARFRIAFSDAYKGPEAIAKAIAARSPDPVLGTALEAALALIPAPDLRKLYNRAIRTACWAWRMFSAKPDAVLGYGPFDPEQTELYLAVAMAGIDVIWFDPEAACQSVPELERKGWTVPEAMTPGPMEPFPTAPERVRTETVAHAASRELDEILYQDTGLYRDRQFAAARSVTLKTTLDEVVQLWPEPPNVRPGFESDGKSVTVPCLFSKIAGIPNADERAYWNMIRDMLGDGVFFKDSLPFLKSPGSLPPAPPEGCSPKEFDEFARRPHDHLPDATRDLILNAAAALCGPSTILKDASGRNRSMVLHAVQNMPAPILDLVQMFDPAKKITKVLVIQTGTTTLSHYECVMLALLDLIGLDVAVFTPPGYRDLEKYLKDDAFDLIQAGPYDTAIRPPVLRKRSKFLSGLLDGLLD